MRRISIGGFTLLELLVVLALAGLLMSLVPGLISAAVPGTRLRIESRELAVSLRDSRNRAIATGEKLDVTIDFDPPQYIIAKEKLHALPAGITIAARKEPDLRFDYSLGQPGRIHEDRITVHFYPDGSSSGAVITLRHDSLAYTVTVDWLLGSVSMAPGITDDEI
jgi:general secretion pathway protein H